jgi:hypothetical protein
MYRRNRDIARRLQNSVVSGTTSYRDLRAISPRQTGARPNPQVSAESPSFQAERTTLVPSFAIPGDPEERVILEADFSRVGLSSAIEVGWRVDGIRYDRNGVEIADYRHDGILDTDASYKVRLEMSYTTDQGVSSWQLVGDAQRGLVVRSAHSAKVLLLRENVTSAIDPPTQPDRYISVKTWARAVPSVQSGHMTYRFIRRSVAVDAYYDGTLPTSANRILVDQDWASDLRAPAQREIEVRFSPDPAGVGAITYSTIFLNSNDGLENMRMHGILVPSWARSFRIYNRGNMPVYYAPWVQLLV